MVSFFRVIFSASLCLVLSSCFGCGIADAVRSGSTHVELREDEQTGIAMSDEFMGRGSSEGSKMRVEVHNSDPYLPLEYGILRKYSEEEFSVIRSGILREGVSGIRFEMEFHPASRASYHLLLKCPEDLIACSGEGSLTEVAPRLKSHPDRTIAPRKKRYHIPRQGDQITRRIDTSRISK